MRRILAVLFLPMISGALAQIDDRGYPTPPPGQGAEDFSFETESYLTADTEIPPVSERDEGPSIEVTEFYFETIPEFPELGITRDTVEALAEALRQEYSQKAGELSSGYTEQELQQIAELLPSREEGGAYSIVELEQVADYLLSISDSGSLGGLRQYELKGLVDLLAGQRLAAGINVDKDSIRLSSMQLDALIQLVKRQRTERGINFYELEDISNKISAFYRSRGVFLARAYIPVQQVEGGVVNINILEGVLGGVTVKGNKKYTEEKLSAPFEAFIGDAAKSDDIEEALYLINDLPGLVVQGALSAGSKIGETSMGLNVIEEKSWRLTVTADNHGAVFTGDNRVLTMVDWLNPSGFGDVLTAGFLKSWDPDNSEVAVVQYRAPVWDERTYAYFSADINEFNVDGNSDQNIDQLNVEGTNTSVTVGMDRQFKRLPSLTIGAGFALTQKETEITAITNLPDAGEAVQGAQLNFSLNHISKQFSLMNMMMGSVQYGEFTENVDVGQDEEFYKLAIDWSVLKVVDLPFTDLQSYVLTKSKWRYSESGLPAFEQLPLGGADAVRAFAVSEFSADQAVYLGAEWYVEFPSNWIIEKWDDPFKVALFVDGAYGVANIESAATTTSQAPDQGDLWANMSGAGLLFKFTWQEVLGTKISFSKPMSSKSNLDSFGDDADSIQTYIEVTFVYD